MEEKQFAFSVIGGDARYIELIQFLQAQSHQVYVYGFSNIDFPDSVILCDRLEETIQKSTFIIGPIPCSQDNYTLFAPYHQGSPILLKDLFEILSKYHVFMAGYITPKVREIAGDSFKIFDLLQREELAIYNAIPTSEGAIQIAMEQQPITIHSSKCLVLGFGRCGKVLAHQLQGLGACVSVGVRSVKDIAYISTYGYQPLFLKDLKKEIHQFDFIFNTIPSLILDQSTLLYVNKGSIIIDLASKPGGVDYEAAEKQGVKALLCLGLPGKVAPKTAGWIIKETVLTICSEMRE